MIFVVTHKSFDESILKDHYQIIHVGSGCSDETMLRDDIGENISYKNENYCELTGLYWIWKNFRCPNDEIVGIVHYRRYFYNPDENLLYTIIGKGKPKIVSYRKIEKYLNHYDIILPRKLMLSTTVQRHYECCHFGDDLLIARNVIATLYPDYLTSFDKIMNKYSFYYANMMICRKKTLDEYCSWLFPILKEVEKKIDFAKYADDYQKRVLGFLSERLLNVWVEKNKLGAKCLPVYNTESVGISLHKKIYMSCKVLLKREMIKIGVLAV